MNFKKQFSDLTDSDLKDFSKKFFSLPAWFTRAPEIGEITTAVKEENYQRYVKRNKRNYPEYLKKVVE